MKKEVDVRVPKALSISSREEADAFIDGMANAAYQAGAPLREFEWTFVVYPQRFNDNGNRPRRFLSYTAALDYTILGSKISAFVEKVPAGVAIDYVSPADPGKMHTHGFRPRNEAVRKNNARNGKIYAVLDLE